MKPVKAFRPQWVRVRPVHLETPHSYLRRLCEANSIDVAWMRSQVTARRQAFASGPEELGRVIHELGGPRPEWFIRAHDTASLGYPNAWHPWEKQRQTRPACPGCAPRRDAVTYAHVRFSFCLRHRYWLGVEHRADAIDQRASVAERTLRRLVSAGHVRRDLYETAWDLIRDNTYLIGESPWQDSLERVRAQAGFVREVDDRLALFPETVRVLRITSSPQFQEIVTSDRYDETQRRGYLYRVFDWAGPQRWVLVEGIEQYFDREFRLRNE